MPQWIVYLLLQVPLILNNEINVGIVWSNFEITFMLQKHADWFWHIWVNARYNIYIFICIILWIIKSHFFAWFHLKNGKCPILSDFFIFGIRIRLATLFFRLISCFLNILTKHSAQRHISLQLSFSLKFQIFEISPN